MELYISVIGVLYSSMVDRAQLEQIYLQSNVYTIHNTVNTVYNTITSKTDTYFTLLNSSKFDL